MSNVKIGESLKRFEDQRFLTGHGRYIDDINLDGQARAVVVRAAYAHATINAIDTSAAMATACFWSSPATTGCARASSPCRPSRA